MLIVARILSNIALVVAIAGIVMFSSLILFPDLRVGSGNFAQILLSFGCMLAPFSLYLFIGSLIVYIACALTNNRYREIGFKVTLKKFLTESFNFNDAHPWIQLLAKLSYLLLIIFLFSKVSYFWNFCR